MTQARKTPGTGTPHGVVYNLAERRRKSETPDAVAQAPDHTGGSDSMRELMGARRVVESTPEVRAERVAQLKKQIADGTYNPDPKEVARKMLESGF